jgi:predicted nuclease of predicted toxin-antitoxin system
MKILIDMNLSPLWVDASTGAGIEAVHWSTIGNPAAIDQVIIELCPNQ